MMKHLKQMRCGWMIAACIAAVVVAAAYLAPGKAVATATEKAAADGPVCVFGWSKDTCAGWMYGGEVRDYGCVRVIDHDIVECKTVVVHNATFELELESNPERCGPQSTCDETKHLNGRLFITGDFTFRYQDPCRFRGAWQGKWKLEVDGRSVAEGEGHGPLGTGSHRRTGCNVPPGSLCSGEACERCYDVQYLPDSQFPNVGSWVIGVEGCLFGDVFDGPFASSQIVVTLSGSLMTSGTPGGPHDFSVWKYCGTSDGTVLAKCEG